jgi:type II secretory ATPase GspE/PulE/Tfp pilus assembly ATPase PilB-like protein
VTTPPEKRAAPPPDEQVQAAPVVDQHLRQAAAEHVSDLHFEPKDDHVRVRFRVEGVLQDRRPLALNVGIAVISRLKMMAKMDIAERRLPQDGSFTTAQGGSEMHVRASIFPTVYGEKMVLHVAGSAMALKNLHDLGLPQRMLPVVLQAVNRPSGLILATGPAGSGKTSTLYSLIQSLDPERRNIVTLEDGIAIRMPQLTQGETNARAGLTFATGLRSIEAQDPDVVLVGELPDFQAAEVAFRCAMTGRLVLTALHGSSTVEAITRLLDMGLEPFAVSSGLSIIIAQRLARKLCEACRELELADADAIAKILGFKPAEVPPMLYRPKGCAQCGETGYRGRIAIFEVVPIDDEMRDSIRSKSPTRVYREILAKNQVSTLRREGWERVRAGETTIDEVMRVC